ncbi:MAG: GAF domain-containing protein [Proteobacteria bacterium]|nr:GAF domain-containing protein [Pseudomonadota bacterium]NDG26009.1 GAF domain-containing protein [Pseudomonadota bacterium]
MENTLFVFYDCPDIKAISSKFVAHSVLAHSPDQLLGAIQKAHQERLRIAFFVTEQDCHRISQLIDARAAKEDCPSFGYIVLSDNPKNFFQNPRVLSRLIDIIEPKKIKKEAETFFMKICKLIAHLSEINTTRINSTMLQKLNEIFIELSAERNPEKLLVTILSKGIELSGAQGGTLFVLNEVDGDLEFRCRITDSGGKEINFEEVNSRVQENSVCGYVALTGKSTNVTSTQETKLSQGFPMFSSLDHVQPQGNQSLLTVPLRDSRGDCRGVLQLANKVKSNGEYAPFDLEDESLVKSFSTQAAICLETSDVYRDVQKLFEGFVKASITAIESRDPSTGGHSERVASMCVALARATTEVSTGIYRSVKFKEDEIKELEYAALLHDFGKIGVKEQVLVKAKKLYTHQLESIKERINTCKAAAKICFLEQRIHLGESHRQQLEHQYHERVRQVDNYWNLIIAANEPNILKKENEQILDQIRHEQLLLPDGTQVSLLTEEEYLALSVQQGSLTDSEREEIESHVRHTYQFLKNIPWTRDFKNLTEIAYCHHEKLDGTGYPRGLTSHEIPLQSKIMTIADIFDALTAADRWYKEAVPIERALEILGQEVKEGKLDPVLSEIFIEKKIYSTAVLQKLGKVA